jgi:MFS family permease
MHAQTEGPADQELDFTTKIVVLFGGVLATLGVMGIVPILPTIQARLALGAYDAFLVKQLIGAVGLAMVVGSPLGGFLTDRLGPRRILGISAGVYVLAGTAGLYLGELSLLVASRFVLGLTAASIEIVSLTIINTRIPSERRAKWMGIHLSVSMFSTLLIQPLSGALGEIWWRLPFCLYLLGLLILPYAMGRERSSARPPLLPASVSAGLAERLPKRTVAFFALLAFLIGSTMYLTMIYAPFFMRHLGIERPFVIALVLTADSAVGAGMAMSYGWSRRFLSARACFAISLVCAALGTAIAGTASGVAPFIAGLLIYGFGSGWLLPNLLTLLGSQVPLAHQGRAAGIVKAGNVLASPLSIVIIEPIAREFGEDSALKLAAMVSLLLLVITFSSRSMYNRPAFGRAVAPSLSEPR